jgi:ADP-heptose:LPS heptosyltransferase
MASNTFDSWSSRCAKAVDLVGYPLAEGYPDKPMRKHLLSYFADELGLSAIMKGIPALTVRRPKRPSFAPEFSYMTMQVTAGWSKYKQWSLDNWTKVCDQLPQGVVVIDKTTEHTLQESIALFANARMHIGIDSFCNHLTNYYWTDDTGGRRVPGLILWGSTQPSAAGYPHNVNLYKNPKCGPCFKEDPKISRMPRGPCISPPRPTYEDNTPHQCMADISVDEVVEAVRKLWLDSSQ